MVAVLAGFVVGWLYLEVAWRLVAALLAELRGTDGIEVGCGGSGLARPIGIFNGCNSLSYRPGFAVVELLIGTALAAVIVVGLARWVTQPLREVARTVEQFGPTNLGLRLRRPGSRTDETKALADAVDRMLDRLAEGYEAQRRFASSASHELRTPLATQRTLIEVSLADDLTPDQIALLTRQLLATNERNERLIDGLLTLAESERGRMAGDAVPLDELTTEVVAAHRSSAEQREVALELQTAPVRVVGERALLDRLVSNLVTNAVKYNEPGGRVSVAVTPDGAVRVLNTGPVVAPEQVPGLFEPFRRASGERLDHGGGVGLGLTIARAIVAAHDGTITAHARPEGGLDVVVELPRA
ncbi:ATP-binding protein [Jatrophihabitans fulvus]